MPSLADVLALTPGAHVDDDGRLVVTVGRERIAIELHPAPGVVAAAELDGFDGYHLHVSPDRDPAGAPLGDRIEMALRVESDDRELTEVLLAGRLRSELLMLRVRNLELVVGDDRAYVLGHLAGARQVADACLLLAAVCARPAQLAERMARLYRRFAGVASGPRWNTDDFHVTLATSPAVRVDWPRRRRGAGAQLVTRLRVETAVAPVGFAVVDTSRTPEPDAAFMPLDVPDVPRGRFVLVADPAISVDAAFARVTPALPYLGAALPHHVGVTAEGVEVLFSGIEEQAIAIEPAVSLTRVLAGRSAHAAGPYR